MQHAHLFGFAVQGHVDRNGLPQLPRIVVSHDLSRVLDQATPLLLDLLDDVTDTEHTELNVRAMIAVQFHDLDLMSPVNLFDLEDGDPNTYEDAPEFYLAMGDDEGDLEDLLIDLVGDPSEDDDEDYLEETEEDDEDD